VRWVLNYILFCESENLTLLHQGKYKVEFAFQVEDSQQSVDESAAMLQQALAQHHNTTLSSYEHLLREAQRVHAASLLKQALADRNLANATALNDILGVAAAMAAPSPAPHGATPHGATPAPKVKRRKVTKGKLREPQTGNAEAEGAKTGSTGRADGSTLALKVT